LWDIDLAAVHIFVFSVAISFEYMLAFLHFCQGLCRYLDTLA
jgi:hypothetical protein